MSWEQEISELLQEAQDIAVRFDVEQSLTNAQKNTAKANTGVTVTETQMHDDDYRLVFNY